MKTETVHPSHISERLEYLRAELRAQRISQDELLELQSLAKHINPGDVELLEAAGVPEESVVLALQHLALSNYAGNEYGAETLTDKNSTKRLNGDTLALFVWREARDAQGDPIELKRMLATAVRELEEVIDAIPAL